MTMVVNVKSLNVNNSDIIDFDSFVMRHGEGYTQYVVEQAEMVQGIRYTVPHLLEYRWHVAMNPQFPHLAQAVYAREFPSHAHYAQVA